MNNDNRFDIRAISRRQMLALTGFFFALPLVPGAARAAEERPAAADGSIILRDGWILRADDLKRLNLA